MAHILIAEDETDVRENLVDLLRCEGHEVESAVDGKQCLEKALQNPPDLILCDVVMPRMNGLEVIEHLRTDLGTADVPFIFLTARGTREDYRAGMDRGADDYVIKPFAASELLQAIETRLNRAKIHRERFNWMASSLTSALESNLLGEALIHIGGLCEFAESLAQFHPAMGKSHIFQVANDIQDHSIRLRHLIEDFTIRTCLQSGSLDALKNQNGGALLTDLPPEIHSWLQQTVARWARHNDLHVVQDGTGSVENGLFLKKICEVLTEAALWVTAPGVQVRVNLTIQKKRVKVEWQWDKSEEQGQNTDMSGRISAQSKIRYAENIAKLLNARLFSDFDQCQLEFEAA